MPNQLGSLTTPEQYVNYYHEELKTQLQSKNIQISKVGFIGFLLHTLGFTQFDIKTYFDSLFLEAFLATASKNENLNLHASIYNYKIERANPSNITGNLILFLSALPPSINVTSREIVIQNIKININNIIYTLESKYTIVGTFCKIQRPSGEIYYVPFNPSEGVVPIMDFYQYDTESSSFKLPYYTYGTYYQKIVDLDYKNGYIYDISISIKTKDSDIFEDFKILNLKYLSSSTDKAVFVTYQESNIIVEFGSGIYGLYVPESEVKISIKMTSGSLGNISQNTSTPYDGLIKVYDYHDRNTVYNVKATDVIKANIQYSSGGTDPLSNEDLRLQIINFIQTRNNLISETDYYNIIKTYTTDFILMFKKAHIVDNCIYSFILVRDLYQVPVLTKSISVTHVEFNSDSKSVIYKPTFDLDNKTYISPFVYIFDDTLLEYPGYIYFESYNIYFSEIEIKDESVSTSIPPLSLYFNYSQSSKTTKVIASSYLTITDFQFFISIPKYNIYNECMQCYDDNSHIFNWYTEYDGIITECFDVEIKAYNNAKHLFTYKHTNICLLYDISQLLTLKIYDREGSVKTGLGGPRAIINDESIVMHIPVMLLNVYDTDIVGFNNRLLATLGNLSINQNRMISDSLQFRFLNTEIVPSKFINALNFISSQDDYEQDMILPFKLIVYITGNKKYFNETKVDSITAIEDLKLELANKLFTNYSGIQVAFYQSKIIDIVHNIDWVKSCDIIVTDSNPTNPQIIYDSNFEMISQPTVISKLSKLDAVEFCPIYIYWDLENITINVEFE